MTAPRAASVEFLDPLDRQDPASGQARVRAVPEGGKESVFLAATFDRPEKWMKERKLEHWFDHPVLYVSRLDEKTVRAAVDAMAAELGGYWLRYYRTKPGAPSKTGLGAASIEGVRGGCGIAESVLRDGRQFSILAATPAWWKEEAARRNLRFYYGPMVLFVKKLDGAHARRAAKLMAETDEQLFCRYDTPRKTLPEILDAFQTAHP